jgi:hypothetical protein
MKRTMTKQPDTMSGAWPFRDKTDWYYVCGSTISCQNKLILCLGFDHFMTKKTMSWNGQISDIVSVCYVMKWSNLRHSISLFCHEIAWPFHDKIDWYYVWGSTISWQHRLILCLRLDHFMTKQTATMSGACPFHDKTDWYYVWDLTTVWVCYVMKWSSPRHSISLLCHEMVKSQT